MRWGLPGGLSGFCSAWLAKLLKSGKTGKKQIYIFLNKAQKTLVLKQQLTFFLFIYDTFSLVQRFRQVGTQQSHSGVD